MRTEKQKLSKQARLAVAMVGEALAGSLPLAQIEACPEQPRVPPAMPEIYITRRRTLVPGRATR